MLEEKIKGDEGRGWIGEGLIEEGDVDGKPKNMLVARSLSTVMEGNGVKLQVMNTGPMPILGKTSSVKHSIKTHGPLIRQPIRQFPERTQDSRCCQCNWCSWPHPGTPYFVCNFSSCWSHQHHCTVH